MSGGSLLRPAQPEPHVPVTIGGREFTVTRARLDGFLRIQDGLDALFASAKRHDTGAMANALFIVLEAGMGLDRATFETAPWYEVTNAYVVVSSLNRMPEAERLAMVRLAERGKPPAWDYPGRSIVFYVHVLAQAYGWTKDQVLDLWPEEALALVQEIEASEFSRMEFDHMHSDLAWTFDKRGKGTYKPLQKPAWMVYRRARPITQMLAASLPKGNVIYKDGMGPTVREQIL